MAHKFKITTEIEIENKDFCFICRFKNDYDMSSGSYCALFSKDLTVRGMGHRPYDVDRLQDCKDAEADYIKKAWLKKNTSGIG